MRLKDLVMNTPYAEVEKEMIEFNPADVQLHTTEYRRVFGDLLPMEPRDSHNVLNVVLDPGPSIFFESGAPDDELEYDLTFASWPLWLGSVIDDMTLAGFSPAQIVAYALLEMTVHGFDEKTIAKEADRSGLFGGYDV